MNILKLAIVLSFLVFAFTAAKSQSQSSDTSLSANAVFVKNCAKCHGKNAEGRHFRGPSLTSQKITSASDDELREITSNGKGHMPKFGGKLTPEQIDELVQQIKALNKK